MHGLTTTLADASFDEVVQRTTEALRLEGFGILSDIDIRAAMLEKLGVAMPRYRILGACNPPLAHRALQAEPDVGLLLPCNVIVREVPGEGIVVGALNPQAIGALTGTPEIQAVAREAEQRLRRVVAALSVDRQTLDLSDRGPVALEGDVR